MELYNIFNTTTMLPKLLLIFTLFALVQMTYQNKRIVVNDIPELSNEEEYKLFKQMYVMSRLMSQNKQKDREQIKNISSSDELSFKNKFYECQSREKLLQEQNQKLRHQLQNIKENYHKLQSSFDNQTNWPLLVFLTFLLFVFYIVYGIQTKVPKSTALDKFVLTKDIGQCEFTEQSVIKKTSGDWIKLLMDDSILKKKQYRFKIKKRDSWPINLGIIKMNNKKDKENSEERIIYGSNCTFYQNSLLKMGEGIGFEAGEIVKIVVQPQYNKIKWEIEDLVIYSYQSEDLNLYDGDWRFAIQMRGNADEVQLIQ